MTTLLAPLGNGSRGRRRPSRRRRRARPVRRRRYPRAVRRGEVGKLPSPQQFWSTEYHLNVLIARYPKPVIAVMDGVVMGGGVGLSAHASHRVVTERSAVAMPEVGIGFFPDVGASLSAGAGAGLRRHLSGTDRRSDERRRCHLLRVCRHAHCRGETRRTCRLRSPIAASPTTLRGRLSEMSVAPTPGNLASGTTMDR